MAFASFDPRRGAAPMADINMVPLIDVMLVLLVIFIVTAPLLTHAVRIELPQASAQPDAPPPERIDLAIDAAGQRHWNGAPVSRGEAAARFAVAARKRPQPEIRLQADQRVPYREVAQTLADAGQAGLTRLGFVTEPDPH